MAIHKKSIEKSLQGEYHNVVRGQFSALLRRKIVQDPLQLDKIANVLFKQAEEGNLNAINILFDRLDGRPHQAIEMEAKVDLTHRNQVVEGLLKTLEKKMMDEG